MQNENLKKKKKKKYEREAFQLRLDSDSGGLKLASLHRAGSPALLFP